MAYNFVRSYIDTFRERTAAISHTSTFRETGQITPEEFVLAGDFLVFKFPSWQWADASSPAKRVSYLPEGKQFLVTRGVPCHRRLDDNFAGEAGQDETIVRDGFTAGEGATADDDGWLRTGGMAASQEAKVRDVRTVDESGNLGAAEDEDEIPDMEDIEDDEEAIIRDPKAESNTQAYARLNPPNDSRVRHTNLILVVPSAHILSTLHTRHTTGHRGYISPATARHLCP